MNPPDLNFSPSKPLSCDTAIMTEVADVKPTVTGTDIKSIKTPGRIQEKAMVKKNYCITNNVNNDL